MVRQRLSYYSEGRIERLGELCTSGAKASVMERLIRACDGSPRTLLRLCQALIHHHVRRADETSTLITHTELVDTLREFKHRLEVEQSAVSAEGVAAVAASVPAEPPARGLYLDEGGHTWVDGQLLTLPLSELEFRLLRALYRQSPEIVPHDALIEAVWPSSTWMSDQNPSGSDEQNLRKLVGRLRERLEPGVSGREGRFVKNVRGRGYWLDLG
jgi:DNA-binding response OmpR family regulator